ncbi:MAG: hypothetical protein IKG82_09345 [Oscillospiraceae bacterium]|nr:hypothetical protein [Oscillospiraceae bacterium]
MFRRESKNRLPVRLSGKNKKSPAPLNHSNPHINNSKAHYDEYANSGFFTLVRESCETDTRDAVCEQLAAHFGLKP